MDPIANGTINENALKSTAIFGLGLINCKRNNLFFF